MDPIVIGALITAGTSLLGGILGKKKEKPPPVQSTPFGAGGQGIASIDLEDIGEDTENIADDIKLEGGDFDVTTTDEDTGILSALKEKLGAKSGKPISFKDMSLEELLAVLDMGELTDVGGDFTLKDFMSDVKPNFKKPTASSDMSNLVSLLETPDTDAMSNAIVSSSIDETQAAMNKQVADMANQNKSPMSPEATAALIQGLASLIQIYNESKDEPMAPPPRSRPFSYQSPRGGIGKLQNIGMNMGGEPSKILARPMFNGNPVVGPGGPKDDIIPVLASDGEFMLSKAAVDHAGGGNHALGIERLKAFNNKGNQRYG